MTTLHYRPAVSTDAAECVVLRGLTRENAISAATLASLGITVESWANDIERGDLPGSVCTDDDRIVGYCFGDKRSVALRILHTGRMVFIGISAGGLRAHLMRMEMKHCNFSSSHPMRPSQFPRFNSAALPPVAVVFTVKVRSFANRAR